MYFGKFFLEMFLKALVLKIYKYYNLVITGETNQLKWSHF
jgi:hypothetical protein